MSPNPTIEPELQRAVKRVIGSYLPPGPERDDLAQEVSMALIQAIPRFRGESQLRTYVLRIAHNVSLRFITGLRVASQRQKEIDAEAMAEDAPTPEARLQQQQQRERLLSAIRRLPLSQRQVLTLALEELSHAEIGAVLGISENAVNTRLHRARIQLKKHLEAS
ncbi:MAG: sigma-70 family RNA polymerase sigma factor [Myxococcota bacterium]